MRKFLIRCLNFGVIFYLLFSAVDVCCSNVAERSRTQPFNIWHDIMGGTVGADVVALGNSLVTVGFNTEYLDSTYGVKAYAMGFSGSQFDHQSYMYSLYRSRNRPPKVMINFIDHKSMSITKRVPDRDQFFPWFFNKDFRQAVFPVEHFSIAERFIPMWRWHDFDLSLFLVRLNSHICRGFKYIDYTISPFDTGAYSSMPFNSDFESIAPLWEKYLSGNAANGIHTVFVVPPLHESCRYANGAEESMLSTFRGFSERYGVPLLDYSSLPLTRDSTFFRDPYHLNGKGSEAFCDTLAKDLRRLELI